MALVVAILLAASSPRFQQVTQRLQVERAAFDLAQVLRYAHARAVAEGIEVVFTWSDADRRAYLEAAPESGGSPARLTGSAGRSATLPAGAAVSFSNGAGSCRCVHLFPDGTSDAAALTVSLRERAYQITVDAATSQVLLATGAAPR